MSVSVTAAGDVPLDALAPSRLPVWADRGDLVVWDGACRVCVSCRVGRPAACRAPLAPADAADRAQPADAADRLRPADAADRAQPADAADRLRPADAADRLRPADAADRLRPADAADRAQPADAADRARRRAGAGALADRPELLLAAAVADEVVRGGAAAPAVVVRGDGPAALAAAHAALGAGAGAVALLGGADAGGAPAAIFTSPDPDAVRAWIAPRSARGRADVVLAADGDLAAAARLVRRGGAVATTTAARGPRPSVTTLVQRELELLAPRDLVRGALACALPSIPPLVPHPHTGGPHGS